MSLHSRGVELLVWSKDLVPKMCNMFDFSPVLIVKCLKYSLLSLNRVKQDHESKILSFLPYRSLLKQETVRNKTFVCFNIETACLGFSI
jgi:hypothetical protein